MKYRGFKIDYENGSGYFATRNDDILGYEESDHAMRNYIDFHLAREESSNVKKDS